MSSSCYVCDEGNSVVLEEHHLIPRRFDGDDRESNVYTLCANCHRAIESMYNSDFWNRVPAYLDGTKHIDPSRIDEEYAVQKLSKLHYKLVERVEFELDYAEYTEIDIDEIMSTRPKNQYEALQYERGKLLAYSTVANLIDNLRNSIGPKCISCGCDITVREAYSVRGADDLPEEFNIELICKNCI